MTAERSSSESDFGVALISRQAAKAQRKDASDQERFAYSPK